MVLRLVNPRRWLMSMVVSAIAFGGAAMALEVKCPSMVHRTRLGATSAKLEQIAQVIETYKRDKGTLPSTLTDLYPGYIPSVDVLKDDWDRPLIYREERGSRGFAIHSMGADGTDQAGAGDDIVLGYKNYACASYADLCWSRCEIVKIGALLLAIASLVGLGMFAMARQTR